MSDQDHLLFSTAAGRCRSPKTWWPERMISFVYGFCGAGTGAGYSGGRLPMFGASAESFSLTCLAVGAGC